MNKYRIYYSKDCLGAYSYQGYKFSLAENKYYAYTDCFDCLSDLLEEYPIFKKADIIN